MVIERVDTQFRGHFPENWLFWLLSKFKVIFFSTMSIILNEHLILMLNNEQAKILYSDILIFFRMDLKKDKTQATRGRNGA